MEFWEGDECNQFRGTDSTIFPPYTKTGDDIWAFEPQVCRSMNIKYEKRSKYAGIRTSHYAGNFGDIANDPHLQCFCRDPPDVCPAKGTFDLYHCVGAPLIASLPHFLGADETVTDKIHGLTPNEADHGISVDFHEVVIQTEF